MKISPLILLFLLSIGPGCMRISLESIIDKEIRNLKTDEAKRVYLIKVLDDYELTVDCDDDPSNSNRGLDSVLYRDKTISTSKLAKINLLKVERYLKIHGHPPKKLGGQAAGTPWVVIYNANNYDVAERNFKKIYRAYLNKDIDKSAFSFYLGGMYQNKFGKNYKDKSLYKLRDDIDDLIIALNLKKKALK